jgi:hypothetical protein
MTKENTNCGNQGTEILCVMHVRDHATSGQGVCKLGKFFSEAGEYCEMAIAVIVSSSKSLLAGYHPPGRGTSGGVVTALNRALPRYEYVTVTPPRQPETANRKKREAQRNFANALTVLEN